jgi:hypothetical protein
MAKEKPKMPLNIRQMSQISRIYAKTPYVHFSKQNTRSESGRALQDMPQSGPSRLAPKPRKSNIARNGKRDGQGGRGEGQDAAYPGPEIRKEGPGGGPPPHGGKCLPCPKMATTTPREFNNGYETADAALMARLKGTDGA